MKGFPNTLSSKEDYEYIRANFPAEQWKPHWQDLLDSRMDWFWVENLPVGKEGIVDDTHKVEVSEKIGEDEETVYMQYELLENPMAKIFRIGFTVAEVEEALK